VTILNPVAASLGPTIRQKVPAFWIPGLNGILLAIKEKLFVTKSVRAIIFDGYDDPVLRDLEEISASLPFIKPFIPPGITEKFAFFYKRNGSDFTDGVFNMFTGSKDVSKMGNVFSWDYSTRGLFPGACGEVSKYKYKYKYTLLPGARQRRGVLRARPKAYSHRPLL
jgi:hypothetical protein